MFYSGGGICFEQFLPFSREANYLLEPGGQKEELVLRLLTAEAEIAPSHANLKP